VTKKITVSLPDDVAERLGSERNVSSYVTEAIRRQISHERTMSLLAQAGYSVTDDEMDEAFTELQDAKRTMTLTLRRSAQEALEAGRRPPR
jgi:predicted CopG family antitoxin